MQKVIYSKRKCKICGNWYEPSSARQRSCKDPSTDVKPCCICGKLTYVTLENYKRDVVCSNECRAEKWKRTNLEKYGVGNPSKSPEVKEKIRQVFRDKYGTDYYTPIEEYSKRSSARRRISLICLITSLKKLYRITVIVR